MTEKALVRTSNGMRPLGGGLVPLGGGPYLTGGWLLIEPVMSPPLEPMGCSPWPVPPISRKKSEGSDLLLCTLSDVDNSDGEDGGGGR